MQVLSQSTMCVSKTYKLVLSISNILLKSSSFPCTCVCSQCYCSSLSHYCHRGCKVRSSLSYFVLDIFIFLHYLPICYLTQANMLASSNSEGQMFCSCLVRGMMFPVWSRSWFLHECALRLKKGKCYLPPKIMEWMWERQESATSDKIRTKLITI